MGYAFSRREGLQKIFKEDKSDKKLLKKKAAHKSKTRLPEVCGTLLVLEGGQALGLHSALDLSEIWPCKPAIDFCQLKVVVNQYQSW